MSTSKYVDKLCIVAIALILIITALFMFGEKLGMTVIHREEDEIASGMFTANDLNDDWDTAGATKIDLNGDSAKITGNGAYFSDDTLYIAYAGKYVISGTLDGSVHVNADGDDKIWLLFDGVNITSKTDAPLYVEQADKVFLTLKESSQNTLIFDSDEEDTDIDGCIYSRDDLTVNGNGNLTVISNSLHGIVCNDSLAFAGGNINITAKKDAVHAHDAIKICHTDFTVSAGDDGLHAGNDDESAIFYLESGNINITECYEGIEANDITIAGGTVNITPNDDGINASGSGKTALVTISSGDITIINKNGRDADGLDSNGSINITGGNLFVSVAGTGTNNAIDYGSENGGKFTISGGTVIACGSSQMAESPDSESTQGFVMQNLPGNANDTINVFNAGAEVISKEIPASFTSVLISSPDIAIGDSVTLKIGEIETEVTVSNTAENGMGGFDNNGGFDRDIDKNQNDQKSPEETDGNNPPELPGDADGNGAFPQRPDDNGTPPEKPDESQRGNMPEMQGGTPPEIPDGDSQGGPQMSDDNMPDEMQRPNPDRRGDTEAKSMLTDKPDTADERIQEPKEEATTQAATSNAAWFWLGASAFVLVAGVVIAVKKK